MGDSLAKVTSGQPLSIPAAAYNAFVDAARAHQGRAGGGAMAGGPVPPSADGGIVLIRNDSGADQDRFACLAITGAVFDPADQPDQFKAAPVLIGDLPDCPEPAIGDRGRIAVLQEPVADGAIARARVSGPAIVQVLDDDDVGLVDLRHGETGYLAAVANVGGTPLGGVPVLWKETVISGAAWAVVLLAAQRYIGQVADDTGAVGGSVHTLQFDWPDSVAVTGGVATVADPNAAGAYNYSGDTWIDVDNVNHTIEHLGDTVADPDVVDLLPVGGEPLHWHVWPRRLNFDAANHYDGSEVAESIDLWSVPDPTNPAGLGALVKSAASPAFWSVRGPNEIFPYALQTGNAWGWVAAISTSRPLLRWDPTSDTLGMLDTGTPGSILASEASGGLNQPFWFAPGVDGQFLKTTGTALGWADEQDPEFTAWLAANWPPGETDPVFTAWRAANWPPIEADPVFVAWLAANWPPIEADPVFLAWLAANWPPDFPDETDPVFAIWLASGTWINTSNLHDYETDPVFVASPAYGITGTQITAWDAYESRISYLEGVVANIQNFVCP